MITEIKTNDIPGRACSYNNDVMRDIMDFHKSEWDACEVNIGKYKHVRSAMCSYKQAIRRLNVGVIAISRSDRLFLIREK